MQNQTFKFRRKEPTPYLTLNNLGNILIQRPIHKKEKGVRKVFEAPINLTLNKNHFVNFTGATFVLATHVEGSFSSTSLSGDMKIFFIANIP